MLVRPGDAPDAVEAALDAQQFAGFKVYHTFAKSTGYAAMPSSTSIFRGGCGRSPTAAGSSSCCTSSSRAP